MPDNHRQEKNKIKRLIILLSCLLLILLSTLIILAVILGGRVSGKGDGAPKNDSVASSRTDSRKSDAESTARTEKTGSSSAASGQTKDGTGTSDSKASDRSGSSGASGTSGTDSTSDPDSASGNTSSDTGEITVPVDDIFLPNVGDIIADSAFDHNDPGKYFAAREIVPGDPVYLRIYGRSYQENDYISLADLRYLRMVHYNFDGRIQVGEMIVNVQIADDVLFIFRELFQRGYQIRKMHLIDDYWTGEGVSSDAASVTDDNTSCFCFRRAANTDTLSRHALGLAIDLNPLENPFLTFDEDGNVNILPEEGTPYAFDRSPDIPHVITESDDAYILFSERGFNWGGHWSSPIDYQHFERY